MRTYCTECGSTDLVADEAIPYEETVGAHTYFIDVPGVRCRACGAFTLNARVLEAIERVVAESLVADRAWDGPAIRWIRKSLGWPAKEFAALLGVAPETMSRWESGRQPPDRVMTLLLERLFRDELAGRDRTRRALEAEHQAVHTTRSAAIDGNGLSVRTSVVTRLEVPRVRGPRTIRSMARCV